MELLGAAWTVAFDFPAPLFGMFRTWYLGDLLGMALLAPLLFMLQRPGLLNIFEPKQLGRTISLLLIPTLVTFLIFTDSRDPLIFFLFPALLVMILQLGFSGTVFSIILIAIESIGLTITGHGPMMLIPGEHMMLHRIMIVQILLAVIVFSAFPVAMLLEEREALRESLAGSEQRYRDQALVDDLTGLRNRRSLNLLLEEVWQNGADAVSLLMIDADQFKSFNDLYGHLAGDDCLCVIARVLREAAARDGAFAFRLGGEEFCVLLPSFMPGEAKVMAGGICADVLRAALPHRGSPFGVQTVSIGVATLAPTAGVLSSQLLHAADGALYQAKQRGRNQVALA